MYHSNTSKKLFRSSEDRKIAGICGGLGDYFGIDPTWFRIKFVLLCFFFGSAVLVYLIAWLLIPVARVERS